MAENRSLRLRRIHADEQTENARLRSEVAARDLKCLLLLLELKALKAYNPDQPRVPAGTPDGGQWADEDGAASRGDGQSENSGIFRAFNASGDEGTQVHLAGGIPASEHDSTVQSFVSRYCLGGIRTELPGQFLELPIAEVLKLAQSGDRSARSCLKLLKEDRFRK